MCWFPSVHDNPGGDQDPRCPQTDTGGAGGARDGVGQRYEHHSQPHGTGDPPPSCEYQPCQILYLKDTCMCITLRSGIHSVNSLAVNKMRK